MESLIRVSSDYAQVERRSVTFLNQTMSRGEVFRLKKYFKIIHCQFEYFNEQRFGLSTEVWVEQNFAREAELLAP